MSRNVLLDKTPITNLSLDVLYGSKGKSADRGTIPWLKASMACAKLVGLVRAGSCARLGNWR